MTRSDWAWTGRCAVVGAAAGNADGFGKPEDRRLLGYERMLGTAVAFTRPRWLAAIVVLVAACGPAASQAEASTSGHAEVAAAQPVQQSSPPRLATGSAPTRGRSSDAIGAEVLGPGDGEDHFGGSTAVRALQRRLAALGFAPGPIDGRYGPHTQQAVTRLQSAHGLAADGIAGPRTLAAIASPQVALYPSAGYGPAGSQAVRALQRRLSASGFAPGPIDGRYGPRTERAVSRFQAARGLQPDGIADPATLTALSKPVGLRRQSPPVVRPTHHPLHAPSRSGSTTAAASVSTNGGAAKVSRAQGLSSLAWALIATAVVIGLLLMIVAWRARRRRVLGQLARSPQPIGSVSDGLSPGEGLTASRGEEIAAGQSDGLTAGRGDGLGEAEHREHGRRAGDRDKPARPAPDSGLTRSDGGSATSGAAVVQTGSPLANEQFDAEGAFILGVLLERQSDTAGAQAAYRQADEHGHGPAACNLGVLLEEDGDVAGAQAAYQRAADRGDANGAFNLGMLLEGQDDVAGALAAYRQADEHGHGPAACNLGVLLEARDDAAGAQAAYQRAADRGDANGAFNLGSLLEEHGDRGGAEAAFDRANQDESTPAQAGVPDDSLELTSLGREVAPIGRRS